MVHHAPWFWLLSDIFETIDPSILNPLEMHKISEKFPKLREGGGGKIGNAQKTKDLFLFSGMASLMNAGLLHGSVCVIDMYNFLLTEIASPGSFINLDKGD